MRYKQFAKSQIARVCCCQHTDQHENFCIAWIGKEKKGQANYVMRR